MTDWHTISPTAFEEICFHLVVLEGFLEVELVSGSGDGGRDIVAKAYAQSPSINPSSRLRRWVFQCKRHKTLSKQKVVEALTAIAENPPDTFVLVASARPSRLFRNWVDELDRSRRFSCRLEGWYGDTLDRLLSKHARKLRAVLSEALCQSLDLGNQLPQPHEQFLSELAASCRAETVEGIALHARAKYIPGLYVSRGVEEQIASFIRPEQQRASEAWSQCCALLDRAAEHLVILGSEIGRLSVADDRRRPSAPTGDAPATPSGLARDLADGPIDLQRQLSNSRDALLALSDASIDLISDDESELRSLLTLFSEATAAYEKVIARKRSLFPSRALSELDSELVAYLQSATSVLHQAARCVHDCQQLRDALRPHVMCLVDAAGSGKTNTMCRVAEELSRQRPALLLFGRHLPPEGSGIIRIVDQVATGTINVPDSQPFDWSQQLRSAGTELVVFIDGINENRHLSDFAEGLSAFVAWTAKRPIRLVITCRDMYWDGFEGWDWPNRYGVVLRRTLREFEPQEFALAVPLYLRHWNLRCTLTAAAARACLRPLLLRFFCEAYGSLEGDSQALGEISDIRLKELFDRYWSRKRDALRVAMDLRTTQAIDDVVLGLAMAMFDHADSHLTLTEVQTATRLDDLSSDASPYVRLLDEDIVICEEKRGPRTEGYVLFVYEEFMEYVVGWALLEQRAPDAGGAEVAALLIEKLKRWPNARGVAVYVALLLVERDAERNSGEGVEFLRVLLENQEIWVHTFWSVVGKCFAPHVTWELLDLFGLAVSKSNDGAEVVEALRTMDRHSPDIAVRLAAAILWACVVPSVVSWRSVAHGTDLDPATGAGIAESVVRWRERLNTRGIGRFDVFQRTLRELVRALNEDSGGPLGALAGRTYDVLLSEGKAQVVGELVAIWPEYALQALNGLASDEEPVRLASIRSLTVTRYGRGVTFECFRALERLETGKEVRRALRTGIKSLGREHS